MPDSGGSIGRDAPHVVVIGGGATGCGVARDLLLRGIRVTLVEYGDLGSGTSSRFHGMLQSGARYAVSDTEYAAECMRERNIVAGLIPDVIEPRGGLFVSLGDDPPEFADALLAGCRMARIPIAECDPGEVTRAEPNIARDIRRAFTVPDATINPWALVNALADDVRLRGGTILTRHQVTDISQRSSGSWTLDIVTKGEDIHLEADAVVNATGSWSARIASLVGQDVDLQLTKGTILVLAHRLVGAVINRCRPPTSHDIIVPTGTVSLFGTTSRVVYDPDTTLVSPDEIQELLDCGEPLIPHIREFRSLRAWAGVRPLVKPAHWPEHDPLPRRHKVIDHGEMGLNGFFTVCGGSLTTHRSMAEDIGDHLCRSFGINTPCSSATTPILGSRSRVPWKPAARYEQSERNVPHEKSICECEQVTAALIDGLLADDNIESLHDLRRRLRLGFGPCQGTFCANRAASLFAERRPERAALDELERFWAERLKGMVRTAWHEQARQVLLSDQVNRGILGLRLARDRLPLEERR